MSKPLSEDNDVLDAREVDPLLSNQDDDTPPNGAVERGDVPQADGAQDEDDVPLADEPSTKELVLVLGSIWVGVFLAALGK